MNLPEKKMVDTLIDLRKNYHALSVKAEFEIEGARIEEALKLKELAAKAELDLSIKIGGCGAIKDMFDTRNIGVNTIIAPMIETPYAMEKFVQAAKFVFPKETRKNLKFLINIETITGFNNLNDITASPYFKELAGVVLGRVDMTGSMGLARTEANGDKIFNIANKIAIKMHALKKDFVIGGEVSTHALSFFKKLPPNSITRFETRKIIFDAQKVMKNSNADEGILKAIDFEFMWLKNKRDFYKKIVEEDSKRLIVLKNRYKNLIKNINEIHLV